jgi:hypothetical protein
MGTLGDLLSEELAAKARCRVVSRALLKRQLRVTRCPDDDALACAQVPNAVLGHLSAAGYRAVVSREGKVGWENLPVDKVLFAELERDGARCTVTAALYDKRLKPPAEREAKIRGTCDRESLRRMLGFAAARLSSPRPLCRADVPRDAAAQLSGSALLGDPPLGQPLACEFTQDKDGNYLPLVSGSLDDQSVLRVIHRQQGSVENCYRMGLADNPQLAGEVIIRWVVSPSGRIATAVVRSSTLHRPKVENCIVAAVRTWIFPQPFGGGPAAVLHPFVLGVKRNRGQ